MDDVTRIRRGSATRRLSPLRRSVSWAPFAIGTLCGAVGVIVVLAIVGQTSVGPSGESGVAPSATQSADTCGRPDATGQTHEGRGQAPAPRSSDAARAEVCATPEPTPAEWAGKILSDWRAQLARTDGAARPEDWEMLRVQSLAALRRLGAGTAGPLQRAALDPAESLVVRTAALEGLVHVDPTLGVETALTLVQPSQPVPLRTASILAMIGPKDDRILPALGSVIADSRFDGRYLAAYALGRRREAEAIPMLEGALSSDPSVTVRCHAAAALGDLGDGRAWDPLLRALQAESSPAVRERIAAALALLDTDRALTVLQGLERDDPSPGVRRAASVLLSPAR